MISMCIITITVVIITIIIIIIIIINIICYSTDYSQQAGWLHLPGQLSILLPQPAN